MVETITLAQLATMYGVNKSKLMFYADNKLLPPIVGVRGKTWLFDRAKTEAKIDSILAMRAAGMSMRKIKSEFNADHPKANR